MDPKIIFCEVELDAVQLHRSNAEPRIAEIESLPPFVDSILGCKLHQKKTKKKKTNE